MLQLFKKKAAPPPELVLHTGGQTVYAVGDVHGRLDLLEELLVAIRRDRARRPEEAAALVFLGDYVDRGPDSKGVVELVSALCAGDEFQTTALLGNHERALLNFLQDPARYRNWLAYGGRDTLQSYGAPPLTPNAPDDELIDCAAKFESLLGGGHTFLRSLKLWHRIGAYVFVHAGVRPGVELEQQEESDLLWIRAPFLSADRHGLPYRIVHGHTPEPIVRVGKDRIALDTGAYASGVLSAVRLRDADVDVIDTA